MADQQTTTTTTEGGDAGVTTQTNVTTQSDAGVTTQGTATETAKTETVLDAAKPDDKTVNVTGDYPDDWRAKYAGTDEKKLNVLNRYASPKAALDALFEARQKISAGQAKQLTPESTPEEIAEWRKANNIPETADKYELKLGDGYIIGEEDKPVLNKFLEKMHGKNASPEVVNEAVKAYFEMQAETNTQYLQKQVEIKDKAQTELRKEFGQQYDRNVNLLKGYIQNQFGDTADTLLGAVDSTGTPLMNQPAVIRKFLQLALDHDPVGASIPGLGMQGLDTIDNEIKTLEGRLKTDRKGYFKDEKAQARYGQLLEMRDRLKKTG